MSTLPTGHEHLPLYILDESDVRDALTAARQSISQGNNPLRNLVLVQQRLQTESPASPDIALQQILFELITQNLLRLRHIESLPQPRDTRSALLAALDYDYMRGNIELEAWSALYYRYVRLDLDLLNQDIAGIIGIDPRQLQRRLTRGIHRLTGDLATLESQARAQDHHLWMRTRLPAPTHDTLFGVEQATSDLIAALIAPGPPWLIIVTGPGGVGKTALTQATLRHIIERDHFEDLLWLNLDQTTDHTSLLHRIMRQLGLSHLRNQSQNDLQQSLRARLISTPTILIIDNADLLEDYQQSIQRIAALIEPGKLLITSRQWPGQQTNTHMINLKPLSQTDIASLIEHQARTANIEQAQNLTTAALDDIYQTIGGNPLAARLTVGQLARLPVKRVLENLTTLQTTRGQPLLDALFAANWEALSHEARQTALSLLLVQSGPATWEEIFAVANLPENALDLALAELVGSALLEASGSTPHYTTHALTRRFLEQKTDEETHASTFKTLLQNALNNASGWLDAAPDDDEQGSLLSRAPTSWLPILRWQATLGLEPTLLGRLLTRIAPAMRRSGNWSQWAALLQDAQSTLAAPDVIPQEPALASIKLEAGIALRWLGHIADSASILEEAVAAFGEQGDFTQQTSALIELGSLHYSNGHSPEARLAYRRAADAAQRHQDHHSLQRALNGLATLALQEDAIEEALSHLRRALSAAPDQPEAQTLSNLGLTCLKAGLLSEAVSFQQQALALYEADAHLPNQARAHVRLASAYARQGQHESARQHFEQGLDLMKSLGDILGQARALANLGAAYREQEQWDAALSAWNNALSLQRNLDDRVGMAYTLYNLGDLQWATGHEQAARQSLSQAADLAHRLQLSSLTQSIDNHPAHQA